MFTVGDTRYPWRYVPFGSDPVSGFGPSVKRDRQTANPLR